MVFKLHVVGVIYRKPTINDNDDDAGGENPWSHTAGWLPHGPPSCGDAENHGLDLDEHGHDCGGADAADADADGGDRY